MENKVVALIGRIIGGIILASMFMWLLYILLDIGAIQAASMLVMVGGSVLVVGLIRLLGE